MIDLYTAATPNGHKISIALEELALPYELHVLDLAEKQQKAPWYLAINPNGRIPALVDGDVTVFESAAILQYLGRKTGELYPFDEPSRARIDSWLFWQMAGLGPTSGNVNWFTRAAAKDDRDPAETALAFHRFRKETARLFGVLERALAGQQYLCGNYSIADICCWTWINKYPDNGGGLGDFPGLSGWHTRIGERPAVQRGLAVSPVSDDTRAKWLRKD